MWLEALKDLVIGTATTVISEGGENFWIKFIKGMSTNKPVAKKEAVDGAAEVAEETAMGLINGINNNMQGEVEWMY